MALGAMLGLFVLTGCGAGSNAGEAPSPTGSRPAETKTPAAAVDDTTYSTGTHPSGLFQSEPFRPCVSPIQAGSDVRDPFVVHRLETIQLCFAGYSEEARISLVITAPDGSDHETDIPGAKPIWEYVPPLEMALGDHRLRVTQPAGDDTLATTAVVRVVRATEPSVHQVGSDDADIHLQLAGFRPSTRVGVFLYGPSKAFPFARPLKWAFVDAFGEGVYSWKRRPADGSDFYAIWLNPAPSTCDDTACAVSGGP